MKTFGATALAFHTSSGLRPPSPPSGEGGRLQTSAQSTCESRWSARDEIRRRLSALTLGFLCVLLGWLSPAAAEPDGYVGAKVCASCHKAQWDLWQGSHHERAMADASDATVKGDFNNAAFEHFGVRSRFFRDGDKFMVETDGADGKLATFEVKFTFGVEPLAAISGRISRRPSAAAADRLGQPAEGARAASAGCTSTRDEAIGADDELHWTKLSQNWNFMCASCHSTDLHKNYDAVTRQLSHDLQRDQRRLRGLSRRGLAPCRLGAQGRGRQRRSRTWASSCFSTSARARTGRARRARRARIARCRPPRCARRSRPAGSVMRAPPN